MSDSKKLQSLRKRINALDEQIQTLINERGSLAKDVAIAKMEAGEQNEFYRAEREAQVLRNVIERNTGPVPDKEMARIFREIMSTCLAVERPITVAYFGPEGTFTQAAALKHFGHSAKTVPLSSIAEIFRQVESDSVDFGVVPVENSTEGVVSHTLDMFLQSSLKISGEVELRVHHNLLCRDPDVDLRSVKKIFSHQQSLAQCRRWLDTHMPGVERVAVSSNAEAAKMAVSEANTAAIASAAAAEIYQLHLVKQKIEDDTNNTTRFLVIGKKSTPASGKDKTTLLVSAQNRPGALASLLQPLADNNISMTKIESRPSRSGIWEYVFFIDIEGHAADTPVAGALVELEKVSAMLKVLGSYPKAVF
ncbi:MAG: prephenate dehydratase [Gammaproteobacteria bacterium]|nr:prephenate dehydratase [Gammaproteobacteria bacterium]MDH5801251.1 prephenate dehydratase [Gammaproteobacteria bacterium]